MMAETRHSNKRPTAKQFAEVAEACKGQISKMATALGVSRKTIWEWCKKNPSYMAAIEEHRGRLLDECLRSARILALGIPKLDSKSQVIGWKERPDGFMLRYLIGKLGKDEGFGEQIDITSKGESIKPDPVVVEVIDSRDKVQREEEMDE